MATDAAGDVTATAPKRSRQALITALLFAHVGVVALIVFFVVQCAGCGKDPTVAQMKLAAAQLTIDQADGVHHELTLSPEGEVRWDGKPLITISTIGVMRVGDRIIAKVDKHGVISMGGQVVNNLAVTPDGELVLDGEVAFSIDRANSVGGPLVQSLDHPAVNLEGARLAYVGPLTARQAILLGFAAVISPSLTAPPAPPQPSL